jgi:hypothetical protein
VHQCGCLGLRHALSEELVRMMEIEIRTLTTFLWTHANRLQEVRTVERSCSDIQEADMSEQFRDLCHGSFIANNPALWFSGKSPSSVSYCRSPATPIPSSAQTPTPDSYVLGDNDFKSPLYAGFPKDEAGELVYVQ